MSNMNRNTSAQASAKFLIPNNPKSSNGRRWRVPDPEQHGERDCRQPERADRSLRIGTCDGQRVQAGDEHHHENSEQAEPQPVDGTPAPAADPPRPGQSAVAAGIMTTTFSKKMTRQPA